MALQFIEISGDHRELGRQYGEFARGPIQSFVAFLHEWSGAPRARVKAAVRSFLPLLHQFAPEQIPEIEGLAEGASIPLDDAVLLQLRGEVLPRLPAEGCTSFAVSPGSTRTGGALIGQTSDMDAAWGRHLLVVHAKPAGAPSYLTWTFAGQLGYHGLNDRGLAHFANNLPVLARHRPPQPGLSHYPFKKRLLGMEHRTEVERLFASYPFCSPGNYMLCTEASEIFDVEAVPGESRQPDYRGSGYLVHTNHYLDTGWAVEAGGPPTYSDTHVRYERMSRLLAESPPLDAVSVRKLVADHCPQAAPICRHGEVEGMSTVGALIADPVAGELHVSEGPPCEGRWTVYRLR